MDEVYDKRLSGGDSNERSRIEKLEMFDEYEEWILL